MDKHPEQHMAVWFSNMAKYTRTSGGVHCRLLTVILAITIICSLKHVKEALSISTEHEPSSAMDQVPLSVKAILSVCTPPVHPQMKNVLRVFLTKKIMCLHTLQGT